MLSILRVGLSLVILLSAAGCSGLAKPDGGVAAKPCQSWEGADANWHCLRVQNSLGLFLWRCAYQNSEGEGPHIRDRNGRNGR